MRRPSFALRRPLSFRRKNSINEKPDHGDTLMLGKLLLSLSSLSLLWGYSSLASIPSVIARFLLQDSTRASSTKALEKWLLLSLVSSVASLLSCGLLLWASYSTTSASQEEYKLWFCGLFLQKATGIGIGYFLYKEVSFDETESDEDESRFLQVRVTVHEGRNLVPKDMNLLRTKKVSSDPYVKVFHGPNKLGKTGIVKKTVDPKWDAGKETFFLNVIPRALEVYKNVECNIFDHDQLSADDSMGSCYIPIPHGLNKKRTDWYPVEKGEGANYCKNATGELRITIEVRSKLGASFGHKLEKTASDKFKLSAIDEKSGRD